MSYCKCRICSLGYLDDNPEDLLQHIEFHTYFLRTSTVYCPKDARNDDCLLNIKLSMQCIDILNYATRIHKTKCYHFEDENPVVSIFYNHYSAYQPIKEWESLCRKKLAHRINEKDHIVYEITPQGFKLLSLIHNIPLRVIGEDTDTAEPVHTLDISKDGIERIRRLNDMLRDE